MGSRVLSWSMGRLHRVHASLVWAYPSLRGYLGVDCHHKHMMCPNRRLSAVHYCRQNLNESSAPHLYPHTPAHTPTAYPVDYTYIYFLSLQGREIAVSTLKAAAARNTAGSASYASWTRTTASTSSCSGGNNNNGAGARAAGSAFAASAAAAATPRRRAARAHAAIGAAGISQRASLERAWK